MGAGLWTSPQHRDDRRGQFPPTYGVPNQLSHSAGPAEQDKVDIAGLFRVLLQHKFLILAIVTVMTGAAFAVIWRLTPIYQAESVVIVGAEKINLINPEDPKAKTWDETDAVQTEIQILSSNSLAREVITALKLDENPEFNGALKAKNGQISSIDALRGWISKIGRGGAALEDAVPSQEDGAVASGIVLAFQSKLSVTTAGKSRAIRIDFKSESKTTAAAVANELADRYIQRQVSASRAAYSDALQWYSSHLTEAQSRRLKAQEELTNALAEALSSGEITSVNEVLQSNLIQNLKEQQSTLEQRVASLSEHYGPGHPELKAARKELDSVGEKISKESHKIIEQLIREGTQSQLSLEKTTALLAKTKDGAALDALAHQAGAQDLIYKNLLMRFNELKMQDGLHGASSALLSRADVPISPIFPQKALLLLLSLVVSTTCAIAFVLALDSRNQTIMSSDQAEHMLGTEVLGLIPKVTALKGAKQIEEAFTLRSSRARLGESIRNIHVRLLLGRAMPPKTIMITSSAPGEGKTSMSVGLAILLAKTGRRTILIDCDMRKPSVHETLGYPLTPGLSNYLRETVPFTDLVKSYSGSPLDFITAGSSDQHPGDLLRSVGMKDLLETLKGTYDAIVIDSPPVRAVSDALVLAPQVEAILFLVHWGKTSSKGVQRAFNQLASAGPNIPGIVLSHVDVGKVRKRRLDDFYDYGALDYGQK